MEFKQLNIQKYKREEIAEVLGISAKDSHFARNVKNTLNKWGYSYNYSRKGVEITRQPSTAEERFAEVMIRVFDLDIQIEVHDFAVFFVAFSTIDNFNSMPWDERVKKLEEEYGVTIAKRTLLSWTSRLIKKDIICKSNAKTFWKTCFIDGKKVRQSVSTDKEKEVMREYYQSLYKNKQGRIEAGASSSDAWAAAYKETWQQYQCCYYGCKSFYTGAFVNHLSLEDYQEFQELAYEIANKGDSETVLQVTNILKSVPRAEIAEGEFTF